MHFINLIDRVITYKWHIKFTIMANGEYMFLTITLIDSGLDSNCIDEGLVLLRYFSKTIEELNTTNGNRLIVRYNQSKGNRRHYLCKNFKRQLE